MTTEHTRRRVLRTGAAGLAATVGLGTLGTAAANPGKGDEKGNGKSFGRVYANDVLWRTNVVKVLDERPDPEDKIYFLHDGNQPIVANKTVSKYQMSPFVSESAPGDRDWNGGKWVHYNAKVTDIEAFKEAIKDAPLDNTDEFVDPMDPSMSTKDYIEIEFGRPTNDMGDPFGPPLYFICPLNGKA